MTAERGLLAALEAGCSAPVGAYAALSGTGQLRLDGVVLASLGEFHTGRTGLVRRTRQNGDTGTRRGGRGGRRRPGRELAARMLALGAADLMRADNTDRNDAHD